MTAKKLRCCRECSAPLPAGLKHTAMFCSVEHKTRWNNLVKQRGAQLYNLWMTQRYDRPAAKEHGVWKEMCRLSEMWHAEDKIAGRTFERPALTLTRLKDAGRLIRARPDRI